MRIVMELDSLDELREVFAPPVSSVGHADVPKNFGKDSELLIAYAENDKKDARIKELESDLAAMIRVYCGNYDAEPGDGERIAKIKLRGVGR